MKWCNSKPFTGQYICRFHKSLMSGFTFVLESEHCLQKAPFVAAGWRSWWWTWAGAARCPQHLWPLFCSLLQPHQGTSGEGFARQRQLGPSGWGCGEGTTAAAPELLKASHERQCGSKGMLMLLPGVLGLGAWAQAERPEQCKES